MIFFVEYIVVFPDFIPHSSHYEYILHATNGDDSWTIVERVNEASTFPSDFAVIRINPDVEDKIIEVLKQSDDIKNVYQQKFYTRSPNSYIEHPSFIDFSHTSLVQQNQTCSNKVPWKGGR